MQTMNRIVVFTDGASRGNPGPCGWGAVVVADERVIELGGAQESATNNRMELTAAIEGLKEAAKRAEGGREIAVYSDSSYLVNGAAKWLAGWKRNGWTTKAKKPVLNDDLWKELDGIMGAVESAGSVIAWKYAGGHIGVAGNERCDGMATGFADGVDVKLYSGPLSGYGLPNILNTGHDEIRLAARRSGAVHSRARAYSYVSMVGGAIERHGTWLECERRIRGVPGARFRKALDKADEAGIIAQFNAG